MLKPTVFLAMPHYTAYVHLAAAEAFFVKASAGGCDIVARKAFGGSLLAKSFNMLWAEAITANDAGDAQYFVMLHSDIGPESSWVDRLVELIREHDADVISVVTPLKSVDGLTSTGIDSEKDEFEPSHRFTMTEVHGFPAAFTAEDAGYPGQCLLVNTGCFIADMNRHWCHAMVDGYLSSAFSIDDCIRRTASGLYQVGVAPEDWQWSRMLFRAGAKVMATTAVKLTHYGEMAFTNQGAWGRYKTDPRRRKESVA